MVKHTQTICWQFVFDHFVGLSFKGLKGCLINCETLQNFQIRFIANTEAYLGHCQHL